MLQRISLCLVLACIAGFSVAAPLIFKDASIEAASAPPGLQFGTPLSIEEPNDVLLVKPRVILDPRGGFLVADAREKQLRRYNSDGTLDRVIARQGDGPGEFNQPVTVLRLPNQRILGVDLDGRLAIFDENGEKVLSTQKVPLLPVFDAAVVDDSTLVFAAREDLRSDSRLVHVWNLNQERMVRSFGDTPTHAPEFAGAYSFTGAASIAVRNHKVALLFALSDTIQIFDLDREGQAPRTVPVSWSGFRRLASPMPEDDAAIDTWLSTFTVASSFFWRDDDSFVVQFLDVNGKDETWNVLGVSGAGAKLFEFHNQPRLLAVYGKTGQLLFVDPNSELENSWAPAFVR